MRKTVTISVVVMLALVAFAVPAFAQRLRSPASTLTLTQPSVACSTSATVRLAWTDSASTTNAVYRVMSLPTGGNKAQWTAGPWLGNVRSASFVTTLTASWQFAIESQTTVTRDSNRVTVNVNCPTPDTTKPSVPTGLAANAASCSQVNLSWNASSDNAGGSGIQGYRVYRAGALWTFTTALSIADTGRSASTSYSYQVSALDNAGNESAKSSAVSTTTPACPDGTPPSLPAGVTASAASCSQVNVSWLASTDTGGSGLKGYNVYRGGVFWTFTAALSIADTGRLPSTAYSYQVTAIDNANNESAKSATGSATTPACPDTTKPSVPTGLGAVAASCSHVNLSWLASTDTGGSGLKGYNLYRGAVFVTLVNALSYSDTGRAPSTPYSYTVTAVDNANNESAQSTAASATTPACPDTTKPSVPTGLGATAASCSQVNLSWLASTDTGGSGLKGYNVYRGGAFVAFTSALSFNDTGRAASTPYSYTVTAIDNANNESAQSGAADVTTPACPDTTPPSVPTGLAATVASCNQVNLVWNASTDTGGSGLKGYNVYRGGAFLGFSAAPNLSDATAPASSTLSYQVTAIDNANNESAKSTAAGATTPACTASGPWAKQMSGVGSQNVYAVKTDSAGNTYAVGTFNTTTTFGTTQLTSAGGIDGFLAKYSPAGALLWVRQMSGASSEVVSAIALDNAGNVDVVGRFDGDTTFAAGTVLHSTRDSTGTPSIDLFLAQYDTNGTLRWAHSFGGQLQDSANGVAVDGAGNLYVTGYFVGTINFGGATLKVPFDSDLDVFVTKFTSAGGHVWSKNFTNNGNDDGYAIAVDGQGNVAVTGVFSNTINFGGSDLTVGNALSNSFIAEFDTNGVHKWSRKIGDNNANSDARGIAIDGAGNVIAVGTAKRSLDYGGGLLPYQSGTDDWIAKYSSTGVYAWAKDMGGPGNDYPNAVAADSSGNLLISGYFDGATATFGSTTLNNRGGGDAYVMKMTAAGGVTWVKQEGGNGEDWFNAVAFMPDGGAVAGGFFYGTGTFEGTSMTSADTADGVMVRTSA